jgi:hypothetical protein
MARTPPKVVEPSPVWDWYFKQERHYFTKEELEALRAYIMRHGPPSGTAYVSPYAVVWQRGGRKPAVKAVYEGATDILGRLPSEIARAHLEGAYSVWRPPYQKGLLALLERVSAPYYAVVGRYPGMAYVDLRAAYYVLYTRWWGLEYWPMRYLTAPRTTIRWDEELSGNKLARNALYGLLRGTRKVAYTQKGVFSHPAHQYVYPQVALAVLDTLHAIAYEVVERWGAIYVHTDGYIVPATVAPYLVEWLREVWGLEARIDAIGDADIRGVGIYAVGAKASIPYVQGVRGRDADRIDRTILEWLKPRYAWYTKLVREITGEEVRVVDRALEKVVQAPIPLGKASR